MAELINYMEKLVFNKLDDLHKSKKNFCNCEQCRLDIAAIALNELSPRYIVTDRGKLYTKIDMLETQFSVNILMELTKGIDIVAKHPRHKQEQD